MPFSELIALPVLVIQHSSFGHAAALLRALESQGTPSQVCRIWEGEVLPDASQISGVVSMGGPMGANDEEDESWILDEIRFVREVFAAHLPIVGICLGAQILARALGGKGAANPNPERAPSDVRTDSCGAFG